MNYGLLILVVAIRPISLVLGLIEKGCLMISWWWQWQWG